VVSLQDLRVDKMSFWKKKPAPVSLTEMLSNPAYMEDFKSAEQAVVASIGTSPAMEKIETSCGSVTKLMVECLQNKSQADAECLLLHHAFLLCAGRSFEPNQHNAYVSCATKNKQTPAKCDALFNEMWSSVTRSVDAINAELTKDVLSEQDEELVLDCNGFRSNEGSIEPWLQCVVPKRCPKG
jgi:hypothetical protein